MIEVAVLDEAAEESESWAAPRDGLRTLHTPRTRALTPPGFSDHDATMRSAPAKDQDADADAGAAALPPPAETAPNPLFQDSARYFRLPPSVRRDILLLAFGRQRVHLHLSHSHPDAAPAGSVADRHCGIASPEPHRFINGLSDNRKSRFVDKSQPKAWRWWSSVCHRVGPDATEGPMTNGGLPGPWADYCRAGHAQHCLAWRDEDAPSACYLGISGWLLSCRQNYAETIDVLYAMNTISMRGEALLTRLPQLLLPQRLAAMTSLEISWPLITLPVEDDLDKTDVDEDHLSVILQQLSSSIFPALRRLYLSLELSSRFSPAPYAENDYVASVVRHLDPFAGRMLPDLRECAVALPELLFEAMYEHTMVETGADESYRQIWRSVNGRMDLLQLPYVDSYPQCPYHLAKKDALDHCGYWVLEGSDRPKVKLSPQISAGSSPW